MTPFTGSSQTDNFSAQGHCACDKTRFRLLARPLIVHCCHCRWCQRETGTAFALNALIETHLLERLAGAPRLIESPSQSGAGQTFIRCTDCMTPLWSHYSGMGGALAFVRVGVLDEAPKFPPDVHIFTASKQPWTVIPRRARQFRAYYKWREVWPKQSRARMEALRKKLAN